MHCHKKKLTKGGGGLNESAEILTQAIDYYATAYIRIHEFHEFPIPVRLLLLTVQRHNCNITQTKHSL